RCGTIRLPGVDMTLEIQSVETAPAYQAWATIFNETAPIATADADELMRLDVNRDPSHHHHRVLALLDGEPVGIGLMRNLVNIYHPQRLWIWVAVRERYRRQGVGSTLFEL